MWLLCANHDSYELGEGYSVNAYSHGLIRLVEWAFEDAIRQNGTKLRVRDDMNLEQNETEYKDVILEYEYCKDSWGIWCVIEEGEVPAFATNVDAETS